MNDKPKIIKLPLPPFKFWYPHLLKALHDLGGEAKAGDAVKKTLDFFDISDKVFEETYSDKKSGWKAPKIIQHVHWARSDLLVTGYINNSTYGVWEITDKVKDTLALILEEHEKIKEALIDGEDIKIILKNADSKSFINRVGEEIKNRQSDGKQDKNKNVDKSETFEQEYKKTVQIKKDLCVITSMSSNAFEQLCLKIFKKLGYKDSALTPETRDGGYDGSGYLKIGLTRFRVAFEAKKYESVKVHESEIKQFATAMRYNAKAQKGVFFTTSDFTRDAVKFANEHIGDDITLINGEKLIELLREEEIGYDEKSVMNENFFKELNFLRNSKTPENTRGN